MSSNIAAAVNVCPSSMTMTPSIDSFGMHPMLKPSAIAKISVRLRIGLPTNGFPNK